MLGHYGERDESIPLERLEELKEAIRRQAGVEADLRVYPAGHAFFNDGRPEAYDAEAAGAAWESTVAFLRGRLE